MITTEEQAQPRTDARPLLAGGAVGVSQQGSLSPPTSQGTAGLCNEALLAGQKEAFEAAVNGAPLEASLGILVRTALQQLRSETRCAFYVANAERTRLHHVAGMPESYAELVDGFKIGTDSLACSLAVSRGEPIITTDVTQDLVWKDWRWLADQYAYRGCSSFPVEAMGKLVGSFAMYFREPREPTLRERELATALTRAAAIIISRDQEAEERARAEEALRDRDNQLQALVSSQALYRMGPDWTVMRELRGGGFLSESPTPVSGWHEKYIPPEDHARIKEAVDTAIRDKAAFNLEHRFRRSDGSIGWTLSRAVPLLNAAGEITEWFGSAEDVTRRRWVEGSLELLSEISADLLHLGNIETQLERLAEKTGRFFNVPQCTFLRVIEGNEDAVTFHGWHEPGVRSLKGTYHIRDFLSPAQLAADRAGKPSVVANTQTDPSVNAKNYAALDVYSYINVPLVFGDGWRFMISINDNRPREWRDDEVTLLREIADRVWSVMERSRSEEALRVADRQKDEFLAMLAHELRNPLAPIRAGVELLQRVRDAETLDSTLSLLEQQVGYMGRLLDDLLDVSRITLGKIELQKKCVELRAVVEQAVQSSRSLIDSMGHNVNLVLPPESLHVKGDRVRLVQVLCNLLNNAGKYMDRGGLIAITVERVRDQALISVRDHGIGIAFEDMPRVFELFTQLNNSRDRSVGGLGVGLALAKAVVEQHGGTLEVHSEGQGHGSEFVVRLPISDEKPEQHGASSTEPALAVNRRVLIVEDRLEVANALARLLQSRGHVTHVAHEGAQGVQAAGEFRPEIVLVDIGLPGLDGYEVCRSIRSQPWGKDMVLVALSGYGQAADLQDARAAGFDHYLLKPVPYQSLAKVFSGAPCDEDRLAVSRCHD
jgi:signal transduction histidine kinase/ActR/RegA family two-component response regulator/PAS domain-containing protein